MSIQEYQTLNLMIMAY